MSYYREQLEQWISRLDIKADRVLDIGGGQKPMTERKILRWDVKQYHILDHDSQYAPDLYADLNREWKGDRLSVTITQKGIDHGLLAGELKPYDVVLCFEVFEYIYNPLTAHQNIFDFLTSEGIAYISYPTIYPLHNPPSIDYLRYSKNAVEKLLAETGFRTWEITPRVATEGLSALKDFYVYERMRPMKDTMQIYDIGYMVKAYK